jgi:hypothetical protein
MEISGGSIGDRNLARMLPLECSADFLQRPAEIRSGGDAESLGPKRKSISGAQDAERENAEAERKAHDPRILRDPAPTGEYLVSP